MLTGLYDAKADRAPVLALSGQVASKVLGRGAFQDVDLNAAFAAVARSSHCVLAGSDHAELVSLACKTALLERDVTHLVFPDEVQTLPAAGREPATPEGRVPDRRIAPPSASLAAAVARIGRSRRPLFIVGNGARQAMEPVVALAEQLGAPVATTFKAEGQISDHRPLGCGVLGRSGTPIASWFMNECDLVVAFGASFSNHTGIAPYKPIVQVDFDPMALGRFHPVQVPVLGDVGVTARLLADALSTGAAGIDQRPEVAERWAIWSEEKGRRRGDDFGKGMNAAAVFDANTPWR
jgi:pyruvate oxidase